MIANIISPIETTLILSIAALYIIHCPFNKVEESFNTQAVHDIINLFPDNVPSQKPSSDLSGKSLALSYEEVALRSKLPWDHTIFPGVVPRTFIGSIFVAMPMKLIKSVMFSQFVSDGKDSSVNESDPDFTRQVLLQIGSRSMLSSLLALSVTAISKALQKRYGLSFRLCFVILTISQFHYMFYAGRFLPNTFAAILANLVFASWINRQYSKSVIYMALCSAIFRFDTALFFGWLLIDAIFIRRFLPLGKVLSIGIPASLFAVILTFTIDSYLWARPVWPEFEGFYFNAWLNQSHNWGTEPFFWYIYVCLPKILLASTPLILLADHKITREFLIPVLAFILTYSFLPHKELRFILFITPLLNICATSGLMNIHYYLNKSSLYLSSKIKRQQKEIKESKSKNSVKIQQHQKSHIAMFLFAAIVIGLALANMFASLLLSRISSYNYPGGQAAIVLGTTKELLDKAQVTVENNSGLGDSTSDVGVYVNNLAAQTGLSRFLQVNGAYYAKTPKLDSRTFRRSYNLIYVILEPKEVVGFLKDNCPLDENHHHLLAQGGDHWEKSNSEIKCNLPNQSRMYCSIMESVNSLRSVNLGGFLRKLSEPNFTLKIDSSLDGFIKTKTALHIIRCSTRSKFNPFSE